MGVLIVLIGLVMIFCGVPIAFVLGGTAVAAFMTSEFIPMVVFPQRVFAGMDQFPLMAIPFFILAGALMNQSGMTVRLVRLSQAIVGRFRGALAQVNVLVSIFFAGITGSAAADASAVGSVLIPAMEEDGYETDFSAAVTACSSLIGPIIPPSIPAVIYAITAGVSVGEVLLAGIVPGLLLGLSQMVVVDYYARKRGYRSGTKFTFKQALGIIREAMWALIMPAIIVVGVAAGIFTPTEAAAVAVVYAFLVGRFVYKTLDAEKIKEALLEAGVMTGTVMLIVGVARAVSWYLAIEMIPQQFASAMLSLTQNPYVFLFLVNVLLLVVGMFLETTAALFILVPILAPLAIQMGISPVHFGAVLVLNLTIGLVTPPLGISMFIVSSIAKIPIEKVAKASIPFILVSILVLLLLTYFPILAEWPGLILAL